MDKIRMYSELETLVEKFMVDGAEWDLVIGWGDLFLEQVKDHLCFALDRDVSAVPNVSLLSMGIRKAVSSVNFSFSIKQDQERCLLEIKTEQEHLRYLFRKLPFSSLAVYRKELETMRTMAEKCMGKMPYVGTGKVAVWTKDSPLDMSGDLDYSFLKLKQRPIVFLAPHNRLGYAVACDKTNTGCVARVHWHMPPKDEVWDVDYCIFPLEDEPQAPLEAARKPAPSEFYDSYEAVRKGVREGKLLVVYEDLVLDIAEFIEHHPGAAGSIRPYVGREIGRWIYGGLDHEGKVHKHTETALELMLKYQVGKINDPFIKKFHAGVPPGTRLQDHEFVVEDIEGVTDIHVLLKLKNKDIRVTPLFNVVESFGRYYTLVKQGVNLARNYACAFTAEENINKEHQKLANAIASKGDYAVPYPEIARVELSYVPLVVKAKGELSKWVGSNAQPGTKMTLRGPFVSVPLTCRAVDSEFPPTRPAPSLGFVAIPPSPYSMI